MKIKNISCTQFAGVRDRTISFEEGINTIYGKNESGKSTLVNLISCTLFQNARINRNRKSDKEFLDLYFPCDRKNSSNTGDFTDGKITFETEYGIYTLSKEWGTESRCSLLTPDGERFHDQETINEILKDALVYGKGVYSDMFFSSQRNTDSSLKTILDVSKNTDTKKEIVDAVSQAFIESNGISIDDIEQAINAKIVEISGKRWDCEREMPVRNQKNVRWSNERGSILPAYYALEDAKKVLKDIFDLEDNVDKVSREYDISDSIFREAENASNKFNEFSQSLILRSERKKTITRLEEEQKKMNSILSSWPALADALKKAKELKIEKDNRELWDKYEGAKKIVDNLKRLNSKIENVLCPTKDEIMQAKTTQRDIDSLERQLSGMNLKAAVKMFGDNVIEVKFLRTGEMIDITGENISITEAVKITIPDVMEMQLFPVNVNIEEIEGKITEQKNIVTPILRSYNVNTVIELEDFAEKIADIKGEIKTENDRLSILLGDTITFEELETQVKTITLTVRKKEEIERDIIRICDNSDIVSYIASKKEVVNGYCTEYDSISKLEDKVADIENELKGIEKSISDVENIPAEFLDIADPKGYGELLKRDLENKRKKREDSLVDKSVAINELETYKENISGDPVEEMEKAERMFEEQKTLLAHWKHIEEVFKKQKENIHDNPMQDIADKFTYYLSAVTSGKVVSEFPEENKLNMNIYSDNWLLDYGKLSEGTKDTVSLAFRLAVLDHLFPNGGGVIILDDPFTDMDAERTIQSCELIKECATRHQVIFLTCKEDYFDMLGGNKILIEN